MFTPSQKILENYADVLINFALNSGQGVKRNEIVFLEIPECAKPLLKHLQKAILKSGAHYILNYIPDEIEKQFYELAQEDHLNFFPRHIMKGRVEQCDHFVTILAESNKKELENVDSKKIMQAKKAMKPYKDWRFEKEGRGKLTWTLGLYGTEAMAKEANLSIEEYWNQIIKACYLDSENPIEQWKKTFEQVEKTKNKLNEMPIEKIKIISENTNLEISLGKNRQWLGGGGRNIPSFEIFTSPDWRGTNGTISFDQPLYRHGNLVENITLEFKDGKVIKATAKKGEQFLKDMIAVENADKIGEFSMTDKRLSKIDKFMAETLFDENFGGQFGNTHLALGSAYHDCLAGDQSKLTKKEWEELGFNDSAVHTDIIATKNRTIIATLKSGEQIVIYKDGMFTL